MRFLSGFQVGNYSLRRTEPAVGPCFSPRSPRSKAFNRKSSRRKASALSLSRYPAPSVIDDPARSLVPCRVTSKTSERSRLRVADDITELVGETPVLQLKRMVPAGSAHIFAKLEYLNPG